MASLPDKVARSLALEPGERVVCAAMPAPNVATFRKDVRRQKRLQTRGSQIPGAVLAAAAVGAASVFRPGDIVTAMLLGGLGGVAGSVIGAVIRRRRSDPVAPDLDNELLVVAVTDRRFVAAGRSALSGSWPDAWRSFPLDGATQVETGERGKLGVVTAFTFSVSRAGLPPFAFDLQRAKDADAFRTALAARIAPRRPDAA